MDLIELIEAKKGEPPSGVPADVALLFEKIALELVASGRKRFSADAICHRIRWYEEIERNNVGFHLNNNATSVLARWWLARHPRHAGFFETRATRAEAA